jgi:TRAP-type C4-dicarboxylate transport system permease small subunit
MAEKFPSWKQALITFFGGIVLAGTSCFGFLMTLESNNSLSTVTAIGFGVSLLMIFIGFIFVILRIVRVMTEKGRPTSEPPQPGVPS